MTRIQKLWWFRTWALNRAENPEGANRYCELYFNGWLDSKLVNEFNNWFSNEWMPE